MRLHESDIPLFPPGQCILCEGTNGRGRFVDIETIIDSGNIFKLNGRRYVCELCVKEAAGIIGLPSEGDYEMLVNTLAAREDQLAALDTEFRELQTTYDSIISASAWIQSLLESQKNAEE